MKLLPNGLFTYGERLSTYGDHHHIQSIVAARCVSFTEAEVLAATAEMYDKNSFISSVSIYGISLGVQASRNEERLLSAYVNGFWISTLEVNDHGGTYAMDQLSVPGWILYALGTPLEDEAKALSHEWSVMAGLDECDHRVVDLKRDGEVLQEKLRQFGLIDTSKKSIHVTRRAVAAMDAGCVSQSSRVLTILERYEAIMQNPSLAAEIAIIDLQERLWKQEIHSKPL